MTLTLEQQFAQQQRELEQRQQAARVAENARLEADRDAAIQAEEDAKAEARRQQAEEELTEMLRRNFFAGSLGATAQDVDRLLPKLRDEWMLAQARRDPVAEEAASLHASTPA